MENLTINALCLEKKYWWLEITTNEPYLYLFGPFDTAEEAQLKSKEFITDLACEGWQIFSIKLCQLDSE